MTDAIANAIKDAMIEGKTPVVLRRYLRMKYKVDFSITALEKRIARMKVDWNWGAQAA